MDKTESELSLEQRLKGGKIRRRPYLLNQLLIVYDEVIGPEGRGIFEQQVFPLFIAKGHGANIKTTGLMALGLIDGASWQKAGEVEAYLKKWVAEITLLAAGETIPEGINQTPNSIDGLVATTTGSLQQGVMPKAHILGVDYSQLPVIVYTDDRSLNRKQWSNPVYQSAHVTRSHKITFNRKIMRRVPKVEFVLGAETAEVTKYIFNPVGYVGKVDGKIFSFSEGRGPLIISHGILKGVGYKHSSDSEYAFLYIATPHGKKHSKRMLLFGEYKNVSVHGASATLAIFAILPNQLYENLVENQFSGIDDFVMNALPQWQNYLNNGNFFSKPRVIGRIEGINR